MRNYDFIKKDNVYFLVQSDFPYIAVFGIGGTSDRNKALKQSKEYCKNMIAKLHIKG